MQAPVPTLAVVTYPPGALNNQARIVIDGVRGAIFVYSNGGPLGALIGSWASTAGTDPYGNVYPQGLSVTLGAITGTNLIIKNSFGAIILYISQAQDGMFVYADTGSATQGALIVSATGKAGSADPVNGQAFLQGLSTYLTLAGQTYAISLNLPGGGNFPGLSVQNLQTAPSQVAGLFGESDGSTSAFMFLTSGASTVSDVASFIQAYSQVQSSVPGGQIVLQAGLIQLNTQGNLADLFVDNTYEYLKYTNHAFGDGATYNIGHEETSAAANQQITSTTAVTVTGTQVNVIAAAYHIVWDIMYHGNQAAGAPVMNFGLGAGAVVTFGFSEFRFWQSGGVITRLGPTPTHFSDDQTGPTLVTAIAHVTAECWVTFSTGGNIRIGAKEGTAGDSYGIDAAFARLEKRQ